MADRHSYSSSRPRWRPGVLIQQPVSGFAGEIAQGPLIPPPNPRYRDKMGNAHNAHHQASSDASFTNSDANSSNSSNSSNSRSVPTPQSNLTTLLQQRADQAQQQRERAESNNDGVLNDMNDASLRSRADSNDRISTPRHVHSEADSASGPVLTTTRMPVGESRSAPLHAYPPTEPLRLPPTHIAPSNDTSTSSTNRSIEQSSSRASTGALAGHGEVGVQEDSNDVVRRCMSSQGIGLLAPKSSSPYAYALYQREVLEASLQQRLNALRQSTSPIDRSKTPSPAPADEGGRPSHCLLKTEKRNRRRAQHTRAVVADLCEIVADLFVAESKLLNPSQYGVDSSFQQDQVLQGVQQFVAALPPRYALGVDTPSQVLLHMRLMAVARSDNLRAAVHICSLDNKDDAFKGRGSTRRPNRLLRLVTLSCADASGLLEYMTKLLSTGGSRVLDADVMTSADGIVLDRYIVEMNGRLRLNQLANYVESFLAQSRGKKDESPEASPPVESPARSLGSSPDPKNAYNDIQGPLYFHPHPSPRRVSSQREIQKEIESAVPLTELLESESTNALESAGEQRSFHRQHSSPSVERKSLLRRQLSSPNPSLSPMLRSSRQSRANSGSGAQLLQAARDLSGSSHGSDPVIPPGSPLTTRERRPLINREATNFHDEVEQHRHYLLTSPQRLESPPSVLAGIQDRAVPMIPFEELMLIEQLGIGRVSTIYRAAWKQTSPLGEPELPTNVEMVALKVATVNPETGDTSHVDELRREADIAALLKHNNICDLIGVAADAECFCLAYEFCEGGSLLSLLSDNGRYYEYLPIALDVANGMAYLHSRNVIHRDLKPSNILLTRDHRAKISDFGMSVANTGQELTAETGTYRYMAPEVIRHESYSSNADVYSFGVLLWQLVTREIPFATMTPIQAAFAVAGGRRPELPNAIPVRIRDLIEACWDQDSHKRPSFTYIAMALADYARMAFNPGNVGAQTLQIANDMLATVEGNSTVNVDFSAPVSSMGGGRSISADFSRSWFMRSDMSGSYSGSNVGLEI